MVITPNSKIKLIKNPLKLDSNNEIMFASKQAQYNYFNSLPKLEFDELTYIRTDGVLKIETDDSGNGLTYEDLLGYNFCMYQNTHFDNKWFYAFITDIKWINPSLTELKLETAYFQTWQFDLIYKDSFIEREHVDNDTIGLHTIPEGLEKGDYLSSENSMFLYSAGQEYFPCVGVTTDLLSDNNYRRYNGIYSGIKYIVVEDSASLSNLLEYYSAKGSVESINSIFMIPINFISNTPIPDWHDIHVSYTQATTIVNLTISCIEVPESDIEFNLGTKTLTRPSQLGIGNNKYTPKNNKLLTNEYMYLLVDNMCGSVAKYDYEYFANPSNCVFQCYGSITPGCSIVTLPKNYKNVENNYSEGLTNAKLPICGWVSDVYTNWLTQNGINIELSLLSGITQVIGGLTLGKTAGGEMVGAGQMTSGSMGIAKTLGEIYSRSLAPRQAQGNTNVGDVMFSIGNITPMFYKMTIKKEYAEIIDKYFTMFGYKVNRVGTPHLHVRSYFDFIKTIDVNIEGDVPESDLNHIRNMFNNGIRFWHDTTNYLNFSVNNNIIS